MTGRIILIAVLALVGLALVQPVGAESFDANVRVARVTYYRPTGNPTASGAWPTEGVTVACSYDLAIGTWVTLDGVDLRCEDRGHLAPTHLDVYCESRQCERWAESLWPFAEVEVWE